MRKIICLAAALLLCLFLSSCGKEQEKETGTASVVVGFAQLGAESSWRIANTESFVNILIRNKKV